jgi:hypothetical protein
MLYALHHLPGDTGPLSSILGGNTWLLVIAAVLFIAALFTKGN